MLGQGRYDNGDRQAVGLAVQFSVDVRWLRAVVAALNAIQATGVSPDPLLLADLVNDSCAAVDRALASMWSAGLVRPGTPHGAIAAIAADFCDAVNRRLAGLAVDAWCLGVDETRASVCLASEIVSLALDLALSILGGGKRTASRSSRRGTRCRYQGGLFWSQQGR